jgi:transposase
MPEHRRRFSPQFKAEAVQMALETKKPIAEVARDLGIHDGTLGNWVNTWRREHPEPEQSISPTETCRGEGDGRRDPPAANGERVPEKAALDSGDQCNGAGEWVACDSDGSAGDAGRDERGLVATVAGR